MTQREDYRNEQFNQYWLDYCCDSTGIFVPQPSMYDHSRGVWQAAYAAGQRSRDEEIAYCKLNYAEVKAMYQDACKEIIELRNQLSALQAREAELEAKLKNETDHWIELDSKLAETVASAKFEIAELEAQHEAASVQLKSYEQLFIDAKEALERNKELEAQLAAWEGHAASGLSLLNDGLCVIFNGEGKHDDTKNSKRLPAHG